MNFHSNIMTETPDMDTMGGRLLRARDAKSMSVAQVAERIGVKSQTILAWESDRSEPRANRLVMLAGFLGVTPTWLMHGIGQAPVDSAEDETTINMELRTLKNYHEKLGDRISQLEDRVATLKAA
ncbi:helix-turn-helix transcriptional regulator [Phyllobacterium sp. YR531]|uniref:helix-turn-helix domain-containing protein n=1 Tax=Phyllobacterium sp. YR531 TaxID=1144343 RepID=UPI00026FA97E|nr:helix-turn-helix transcriptional regulator [Phyllobacterium sp. YR531]EJN05899.1 putative transcription factor, MBF1 like protein [Phyllobacterium sp. YR531]